MKKVIYIVFLLFFYVFLFLVTKKIIIYSQNKKLSLNDLNTVSTRISYEQAVEDVDRLFLLIKTKYAGYEFYNEELDSAYKKLKKKYENKKKEYLDINIFYNDLVNDFNFLKDGHFLFCKMESNDELKISRMHNHYNMYFSDILLQKKGDAYFLYEDEKECLLTEEINSQANDKNVSLLFYPSNENYGYRIGVLSQEKINNINISFNDEIKTIPLHINNCINYHFDVRKNYNLKPYINVKETANSIYIACNTFSLNEKEDVNKFNKIVEDLKFNNKKNIIFDFRGNQGGYLNYPLKLMSAILFEKKNIREEFIKEYVKQDIRVISFMWLNKRISRKYKNNKFICDTNTNLFVLVDQNTASAAERIIQILDRIDNLNFKIIGTNTAGLLKSADPYKLKLTNSNIYVCIPSAFQKDGSCEEYGIFPDVWAIDEDVLETLILYTGDFELNNVLKNLNFQLE